ncbi:MarR family winged helix-turn-helix transcriptional regulator [Neobacillus sp. LXY-1]|uniref:MarR family winged helix-turn-helix transcriptional regulator n=1 Tax=Neobacillus sp. LXY-1 TaxID=3379133 RepID=UPI003EE2FFDC
MYHELFHTLHQLSRHLTNKLNEALKPLGLYSSQWAVIYVLHEKGSLTQKQLCEYLFVEAPPMTRTIQRLVSQRYVMQIPGKDKREKYIQLTEEAINSYPKWEQVVNETNKALLEGVPDTIQKQLLQLQIGWLGKLR